MVNGRDKEPSTSARLRSFSDMEDSIQDTTANKQRRTPEFAKLQKDDTIPNFTVKESDAASDISSTKKTLVETALISLVDNHIENSDNHVYEDPRQPVRTPGNDKELYKLEKHEIEKWLDADKEELDGLTSNGVLEEVSKAQCTTKIIPTRIIRKLKSPDEDGRRRLKSRCVVRGCFEDKQDETTWTASENNHI